MSDGTRDGAGPEALLEAVLAALRAGVDEGAPALYGALAPRARGPLGGEAGLRRALDNALLAPLVATTRATVDPWDRRDAVARTTVAVDGPNGAARYLVSARRGEDGWALTGVRRDDLPPI
ncbi:MAG: hypothetical protein ABR510_04240 [Trueperaceae bacterium]